jgi:uncharacterized protein
MPFPNFIYHPDPIATGSIIESNTTCVCCNKARGYIYVGPVYSVEELNDSLCPWRIADGSAHERFDASFTDVSGIGGYGHWDTVPKIIVEEIAYRTPGFCGWQQERWWSHCGDAATYIGRAGKLELLSFSREAIASIQKSTGLSDGPEWEEFFKALDKDGSPTAYIFKCTKCGALGGYQDRD